MRRLAKFVFVAVAGYAAFTAMPSIAQGRGQRDEDQQQQDDAKKRKRDDEWGANAPTLPQLRNAGPCPFVKVLYDAARYVEFKDNHEASAAVAYSGEIEGISAGCEYKDNQPIKIAMQVLFDLGRGPQGADNHKTYRYWVAVTHRNQGILAKEYFDLPVSFPAGKDRVLVTETLGGVTIPRNDIKVSGSNFEVLIGFDVTPQMADFNRQGKRFRANAGTTTAQTGTPQKP